MAKEIELPDGSIAEFPDDMDDGAIGQVLRKQFPQPSSAPPRAVDLGPRDNTFLAEARRQIGLSGRALANAVTSPIQIGGDALAKGMNAMVGADASGKPVFGLPSQQINKAMNYLGLPEPSPDRPIEQIGQGVAQSAAAGMLPAGIVPQVLGNAAVGSALAPQGQEASGAAWGAGSGAVGHALSRAMAGMVKPTPEARTLMDQGVALTPGQAAGKDSWIKKTEEYLGGLPVANHFIKAAQGRAVEDANVAAAQVVRNMVGTGVKLGKPPREAIEQTREAISKTYTAGLDGMSAPAAITQAQLGLRLQDLPKELPMVPESEFQSMWNFVDQRIGQMASNKGGMFTGTMLKQLDSEMGQHIRNLSKSTVASDKTAAPAWRELQQSLREVMEMAQPDKDKLTQLKAANKAYRELLTLERAMLPGNDTFTPRQLKAALERMNNNTMPDTELGRVSQAMSATLPNQVPSSGSAERLMMGSLPALLLSGGAGAQGMGYDTLGTGMMAAGALGSRPGARFMTGATRMQKALAPYDSEFAAAIAAALRGNRDE